MLILQFSLFILAILFAIWLYMLVLCENPPAMKRLIYPCIKWWQDHHDNLLFSIIRTIIANLLKGLEWLFLLASKIAKILGEILGELFIYLILSVIIGICVFIFQYISKY